MMPNYPLYYPKDNELDLKQEAWPSFDFAISFKMQPAYCDINFSLSRRGCMKRPGTLIHSRPYD